MKFSEDQTTAGVFAAGCILGAMEFMSSAEFSQAGGALERYPLPLYFLYFAISALSGGVVAFVIFYVGASLYQSAVKENDKRVVRGLKTAGLLIGWIAILFLFCWWLYR